jgi:hypothetical protein
MKDLDYYVSVTDIVQRWYVVRAYTDEQAEERAYALAEEDAPPCEERAIREVDIITRKEAQ